MLLRRHFPQFDVKLVGNTVFAKGNLITEEGGTSYKVEVTLTPWNSPAVRIVKPEIPVDQKLHIYSDGTLCLYDWREQQWQKGWHLHEKIIPWTAEWLMFYELYLMTGKWVGKSAVHGSGNKEAAVKENKQ